MLGPNSYNMRFFTFEQLLKRLNVETKRVGILAHRTYFASAVQHTGMHLRRIAQPLVRRTMSSNVQVRSTAASGSQVYESKRAVDEYLLFHYGYQMDHMPHKDGPVKALNFPARCAKICVETGSGSGTHRALDIGCAVGASSFELARSFEEVIGIDFSKHFVDAANKMKNDGAMKFDLLVRGKVYKTCETGLDQSIDRDRVQFQQGDACNLPESLGKFDTILASNLLCRLPDPRKFLNDVPAFLKPGGCLVLISPYSWLEEYTPVDKWIGGTPESPDSAAEIVRFMTSLPEPMELIHQEEVDFVIREHERKFQYGVSDCMVWRKR